MAATRRRTAARRHRPWLRIALAVGFTAAVATAVIFAMSPHHGTPGAARPARQASTASAAMRSRAPAPAQLPLVSVAGLTWTDFHGVELPVSRTAGPRAVRGGLASGFADTPLGALLAAVNIGVRANAQWGPGIFGPTIRRQVTGPDSAALLAACQVGYAQDSQAEGIPAGQPLGPAYVTEEAFRWLAYTPAAATVAIVSAGPGSGGVTARAVTRISVRWSAGDWRVIAPPGGDWGNAAAAVTSLAGYTVFPVPPA
jgi:hypothetical protein